VFAKRPHAQKTAQPLFGMRHRAIPERTIGIKKLKIKYMHEAAKDYMFAKEYCPTDH
jgi:hypothetical protein